MPPEFGRKWGTECLNTSFPLPILQCVADLFIFFVSSFFNLIVDLNSRLIDELIMRFSLFMY